MKACERTSGFALNPLVGPAPHSPQPPPENTTGRWIWVSPREAKHHIRCSARSVFSPLKVADSRVGWLPWNIHQYPGKRAILAAIWGVKPGTVKHWLRGCDPLPLHVAYQMEAFVRAHAAMSVALAEELRAHAEAREPVATRPRGFMAVRNRNDSGITRNARWWGGADGRMDETRCRPMPTIAGHTIRAACVSPALRTGFPNTGFSRELPEAGPADASDHNQLRPGHCQAGRNAS